MKVTVSSKGQIVIPKKIRDTLHIKENETLYVAEKNGQIVLEKIPDIMEFAGKYKGKKYTEKQEKELFEKAIIEDYFKNLKNEDHTS